MVPWNHGFEARFWVYDQKIAHERGIENSAHRVRERGDDRQAETMVSKVATEILIIF